MDDLISRQAALSTIEKMYKMCEGNLSDYHDLLVACFTDLTPAQRWIPCSERLPEEQEEVLVSTPDYIYIAELETIQGTRCWSEVIEYRTLYDVIAWMPLPEPWKGEEHGTSRAVLSQKPVR